MKQQSMPLKLYTDKLKKLAERLKNPNVLLVLGVAGILLIFVSSFRFLMKNWIASSSDPTETAIHKNSVATLLR